MTWTLGWWLVLGLSCAVSIESQGPLENVALNKSTGQSSDYEDNRKKLTSDLAVDGDKIWSSCTHTEQALVNWWYVDLGSWYTVDFLRITNRAGSQGYRLRRFKILGSRYDFNTNNFNEDDFTNNYGLELCAEQIDPVADGATVQFTCSHMQARFIYIVTVDDGTGSYEGINNQILSLCEVEVFVVRITTTSTPVTTTARHVTITTAPGTTTASPVTTTTRPATTTARPVTTTARPVTTTTTPVTTATRPATTKTIPVTTTTTAVTTTTRPVTTTTRPVTTTTSVLTASTIIVTKKATPSAPSISTSVTLSTTAERDTALVINQSYDNSTLISVIVACTVTLAVIVVVATVFIIRAQKSPATAGNVDVGQPVYVNQNFHEGHDSAVKGIRSYGNGEREDYMLSTQTEYENMEAAPVKDLVEGRQI